MQWYLNNTVMESDFIECKPYYSPREFSSVILAGVYIPPQAPARKALHCGNLSAKLCSSCDWRFQLV